MSKYRKKPVVIEAFRWTGDHDQTDEPEWIVEAIKREQVAFKTSGGVVVMEIMTLEGRMYAFPGDWVIQGVENEIYPCKPSIFEATYEPVEG